MMIRKLAPLLSTNSFKEYDAKQIHWMATSSLTNNNLVYGEEVHVLVDTKHIVSRKVLWRAERIQFKIACWRIYVLQEMHRVTWVSSSVWHAGSSFNTYCWYQQFELVISLIRIADINNRYWMTNPLAIVRVSDIPGRRCLCSASTDRL